MPLIKMLNFFPKDVQDKKEVPPCPQYPSQPPANILCFFKGKVNYISLYSGFPGGASGKEPAGQRRRPKRCRFDPWVGKIPQRKKWQPAPVFSPGNSHGQRSLAGCSTWGCKELDTTEATQQARTYYISQEYLPVKSAATCRMKEVVLCSFQASLTRCAV